LGIFAGVKPVILQAVRETIIRHGLLKKGDKILLAFSGGLDSTGLLAVFLELRREWELEIFLGHFNHRIRPSAHQDEHFVRKRAQDHTLPLFVASEDVRSYAARNRMNLEEAGRLLRYDFLSKTAQKIGQAKIATGHTLNDQAETFFLRLMRGSGLTGLAGIYPEVDGQIIRPLLDVERKDIAAYVQSKGLAFREDETNLDRNFVRNRIRLDLIPFLQENFEPKIVSQIGKTAAIIQEEDDILAKLTKHEAEKAITPGDEGARLDVVAMESLPRGLARRVVREFIRKLKGDLRGIAFDDVESVLKLGEGENLQLTDKLLLKRAEGQVFLRAAQEEAILYAYEWDGSHPLVLEEVDAVVEADLERRHRSFEFEDDTRAYLDGDNIQFPLLVRNRRKGDKYRPLGAPGTKKIKEIMREKSIPLAKREKAPVFLSNGEIIWALGLPVAERHKVRKTTRKILVLSVTPRVQR
jgi:tRNA(Ile)-lysidine synthase